jgi:hypothetical protein
MYKHRGGCGIVGDAFTASETLCAHHITHARTKIQEGEARGGEAGSRTVYYSAICTASGGAACCSANGCKARPPMGPHAITIPSFWNRHKSHFDGWII